MDLFSHFHQNSCCVASKKNNNNNNNNDNNNNDNNNNNKSNNVKIKKRAMSNLELYFNDIIKLNPSLGSFLGKREMIMIMKIHFLLSMKKNIIKYYPSIKNRQL